MSSTSTNKSTAEATTGTSRKLALIGWGLGFIVFLLASLPIVYFVLRITILPVDKIRKSSADQAFLDSSMGNWFATMLGLTAGIPVGLFINRKQQEEQENNQNKVQKEISNKRKIRILALVKNELNFNLELLEELIKNQEKYPKAVYPMGMKNLLWQALSDGGDLQWIDDINLLDSLATAYYGINSLIRLEEKYYDADFNMAVIMNAPSTSGINKTYSGVEVVESVLWTRPQVLQVLNEAIADVY